MTKSMIEADSWYLIYTKPKMEDVAQENLERQGFATYLPKISINKRCRGRYREMIEAMFPRYVFIKLNMQVDNLMPIRSTIGVANMVRFGGLPAQVPVGLVSELQSSADENGLQYAPSETFQEGDQVEFINGALTGYRATFERYMSSERIAVLLDIVGKHTRMLVSKHDLQLAI